MRYQTDNTYRKYIPGYGFLSFARNFGNKYGKKFVDTEINTKIMYGKKIMDTTKKEGIKFAKISSEKY